MSNNKNYNNYGDSMVKLLKMTKKKDGKTYHNLYIQVSPEGFPIQIQLSYFNYKLKNLLLAIATDAEIKQYTQVSEINADADGVIGDGDGEEN